MPGFQRSARASFRNVSRFQTQYLSGAVPDPAAPNLVENRFAVHRHGVFFPQSSPLTEHRKSAARMRSPSLFTVIYFSVRPTISDADSTKVFSMAGFTCENLRSLYLVKTSRELLQK